MQKVNDAKRKQDDAKAKAEKGADKTLSDNLAKRKAANDAELAQLEATHQDGITSDREYYKQRQQLTLQGIAERESILAKAGRKETDEYKKLTTEKLQAETQYKRELLKLNLADSKSSADKAIAGLGLDKEDGTITESDFIERKRGILVASLAEQKQILIDAGQGQSQLIKQIDEQLLDTDREYLRDKLKLEKAAWKDALQATKEGLRAIDQEAASEYENRLTQVQEYYNKLRLQIQQDLTTGNLSQGRADELLHLADVNQLKAELAVY